MNPTRAGFAAQCFAAVLALLGAAPASAHEASEAFGAIIHSDIAKWAKVIKDADIKAGN